MEPITRDEIFMAAAAGEYSGELPAPITRQEQYLKKIIEEIDGGGSVSPEQIDAAIEAYLNSHDADIVTEQELSDELSGYYNKTDIDNALDSKADSTDIPDVSDFVTTAALAEKQDALTAGDNISIETINGELTISATDTTYSDATQQTHGLMSTADKTKLDSITAAKIQAWDNAEQNVNADWTAESGDAQILHKPDLSVYALAVNVTKSALGIDNVDNTSDADKPISTATQTALNGKQNVLTFDNAPAEQSENPVKSSGIYSALAGKISVSAKGANGGVAELDSNGKVPSSQLPSYVDDVLSYNSVSSFPATGEDGKIYIAKDTNLSYRWTGSEYGVISPSLALGNTSSTAYRGDWGAQDRAAIGTLTSLQTTAKSDLVAAINEIKNVLTFDSTPTENSTNPVTSGGVYTALAGKADATATQTALNAKQDALTAGDNVSIATVNGVLTISATDTTYSAATASAAGLMSAADKEKLDKMVVISSANYEALNPPDSDTLYFVLEASGS